MMQDILHEGLDEVLGPERVYCYPYKDYSRFQYNLEPESAQKTPHRRPVGRNWLAAQQEAIAVVIVSSVRPEALETWAGLQHLFDGAKVALINGEWSPIPSWPVHLRYDFRFTKDLLPEYLSEWPDLLPLTYSVPPRVMIPSDVERDLAVSFVARSTVGLRQTCAEALAREGFLVLLDADIPREQYCWILNRSRMAVSIRGFAWDSLRYWEIPYHGALLLSQRLPIVIPDNFVDGESAVFFDTPEELLDVIRDLLVDEKRRETIAAAGRRLAWEKHTAAARARYVLRSMGVSGLLGLSW